MAFFGSTPQTGSSFTPSTNTSGGFFGTASTQGTSPIRSIYQAGSVSSDDGDGDTADNTQSGYHFVEVTPGSRYTITANRLENDLDPAMWVFSDFNTFQDFLDSGTLDEDEWFTEDTLNFLATGDDEVDNPGPYGDPQVTLTAPESGRLTIVVTNYASDADDGGDGRFEYRLSVIPDSLIPHSDSGTGFFNTAADTGGGHFGQEAERPSSPWSEPVLLDFEGIASTGEVAPIPNGYGDLDWFDAGVVDSARYVDSGYINVLQSGSGSTFNNGAELMGFTTASDDRFDLVSGFFAAAWNNDLNVIINAYRDGEVVGTAELELDPFPAQINFIRSTADANAIAQFVGQFTNLDGVTMDSYGGSNAGLDSTGEHFTMDDLILRIVGDPNADPAVGSAFFGFDA